MSEDGEEAQAKAWVDARFGARAVDLMTQFSAIVVAEAQCQNLVSPSSLEVIWQRHILDSAQLIPLAAAHPGPWLDIGTGAGFPGIVVAALTDRAVYLVEPRKKRVDFLAESAERLGIAARVTVVARKIADVTMPAAILSARAVAPLHDLFDTALQCAYETSLWLMPKGKTAREDIAKARETWHAMFHVEQSITDPDSLIVLATGVSRR